MVVVSGIGEWGIAMVLTKRHVRPMCRQELEGDESCGWSTSKSDVDSESSGIHDAGGQTVSAN